MREFKSSIIDREWVNNHIRGLQAARSERKIPTDGWDAGLLESVVQDGLDVLSDGQIAWLFNNPVALFQLHEAVVEGGGGYWYPGVENAVLRSWMEIDV